MISENMERLETLARAAWRVQGQPVFDQPDVAFPYADVALQIAQWVEEDGMIFNCHGELAITDEWQVMCKQVCNLFATEQPPQLILRSMITIMEQTQEEVATLDMERYAV